MFILLLTFILQLLKIISASCWLIFQTLKFRFSFYFWFIIHFISAIFYFVHTPSYIFMSPESEFNEFKPRLKSPKKPVSIQRRLKPWKIKYNFKWNQLYLSRGLNLSRGSNSLNSASECINSKFGKHKFLYFTTFVDNFYMLINWFMLFMYT